MSESDVVLRATWGKVSISKSMDGEVYTVESIMKGEDWWPEILDYTMVTSITTKDNTDIPDNVIEWWDASEAQDQSVIAYIEDDGSGAGTYKVTIGGQGGIIANPDSNSLFYYFTSLESIDLTHLDTSKVTNMSNMFRWCNNLTNLDLSSFDTSSVTSMISMFQSCSSLTSINFGNDFNTSNVLNMNSMFRECSNLINKG